jgi:hypothetical protein
MIALKITYPSSPQRRRPIIKENTQRTLRNSHGKDEKLVANADGQTGRLTVDRKITLNFELR